MPLLHATDSSITLKHSIKATSNDLFMRNAFLIYRLVVLGKLFTLIFHLVYFYSFVISFQALLTNFALLSLIFSAWNISATLSIVPGSGKYYKENDYRCFILTAFP